MTATVWESTKYWRLRIYIIFTEGERFVNPSKHCLLSLVCLAKTTLSYNESQLLSSANFFSLFLSSHYKLNYCITHWSPIKQMFRRQELLIIFNNEGHFTCHTIHTFSHPIIFSVMFCNHHKLTLGHFHYSQNKPCTHLWLFQLNPTYPLSTALDNTKVFCFYGFAYTRYLA